MEAVVRAIVEARHDLVQQQPLRALRIYLPRQDHQVWREGALLPDTLVHGLNDIGNFLSIVVGVEIVFLSLKLPPPGLSHRSDFFHEPRLRHPWRIALLPLVHLVL